MEGTYVTLDGKPAVRFERSLDHPVEVVWEAVTDPAKLAQWFPTSVEVDLREGGAMSFAFPDGEHGRHDRRGDRARSPARCSRSCGARTCCGSSSSPRDPAAAFASPTT